MTPEFSPPVVVAQVVRSGFVEGHHHGSWVLLNSDGSIERSAGYLGPIFPRSSNKLMQATAMVENGFNGPTQHLALSAASHDGEPIHVATVREILGGAGLDENYLQTPPDWPYNEVARLEVVRAGGKPESITMNCSGKHAGMLATCTARGWTTHDYRSAEHPLQLAIASTMERMCGEPVAAVGVDGCGAPVMAVSLIGLARAFSVAVQAPEGTPERRIADAMRAHPELVGGTGREVTALMAELPGVLAKDGAEAVMALALPDGRALALKIDDGADRACSALTLALLEQWDVDTSPVRHISKPIRGWGQPVGEVRAVLH
jgi:L-asparaginase II